MHKKKIAIIGAGNVVIKRIKPALESFGYKVITYSNNFDDNSIFIDNTNAWLDTLNDIDIIWIATPSFAHISYLKELIKLNKFIIIEKPITCIKEEIQEVENILETYNRKKLFFTSYYLLEKALPLYYFKNPSKDYLKYLNFYEYVTKVDSLNIKDISNRLGNIKRISMAIIEGKDERVWPYLNKNGTHLLETFIHNMLITTLFTSFPNEWTNICLVKGNYKIVENEKSPNLISLFAKDKNTLIELEIQKNIKDERKLERYVKIDFQYGHIIMNLETQDLKIILIENDAFKFYSIKVKKEFKDIKYSIQSDLALRCFNKECKTFEVDSLVNQLEIINWLLELKDK